MTRWMLAAILAVFLAAAGCGTDEPSTGSNEKQAPVAEPAAA